MAELFFEVYAPKKGDLIPALDVEDEYVDALKNGHATAIELVNQIVDLGYIVKEKIGRFPFLYIRDDIVNSLGNPNQFSDFPLWIANYDFPSTPKIPYPWIDYVMWQYSSAGTLPGVPPSTPNQPGEVDFNFLDGDESELANLTIS